MGCVVGRPGRSSRSAPCSAAAGCAAAGTLLVGRLGRRSWPTWRASRSCRAPTTTSPASPCCSRSRGSCASSRPTACASLLALDGLARRPSRRACRPSRGGTSAALDRERDARSSCLDTVGSPELDAHRGRGHSEHARLRRGDEGPRRGARRARRASTCAAGCASRFAHRRAHRAARRATAPPCSARCNESLVPANYHWPTDTPDNVDFETVARRRRRGASRVVDAAQPTALSRRRAEASASSGVGPRPRTAPPPAARSRRPSSRPGVDAELARPARRRAAAARARPRARQASAAAEHLARELDVARDRLLGLAARAWRGGRRPTAA